jgi:transposase
VFSLHGVDAGGRTVLRKTVRRDKLMELIASLPPCLIGMEACGGAHEWARQFQRHGHRVGIMMARFVALNAFAGCSPSSRACCHSALPRSDALPSLAPTESHARAGGNFRTARPSHSSRDPQSQADGSCFH